MRTISLALAVISLLMITYQDFRTRSVHWIYFPLLALAGMGMIVSAQTFGRAAYDTGFNLVFVGLQLAMLKIYFFARARLRYAAVAIAGERPASQRDTTLINKKIGLGDILFLAGACFFFSPANFIAFYMLSLLFAIGAWSLTGSRTRQTTIPLAGLQAIFLLLTLCAAAVWHYSLLDDGRLLLKITAL